MLQDEKYSGWMARGGGICTVYSEAKKFLHEDLHEVDIPDGMFPAYPASEPNLT